MVLSGPSGVGKDTVIREWERIEPDLSYVITCTTRAPRDEERNGVHYHFLTEHEFDARVSEGAFLEYKEVHGHYYATPKDQVDAKLSQGKIVLLKIDVQGALTVREARPDTLMIFLAPPSFEELERRIRERRTDTEAEIEVRLQNARWEMDHADRYDFYVVNDVVERATKEIEEIVSAHR